MNELIQRICASVGIDENTAKAAIGHVLGFVQKEIPQGPVADLINKLPGAQDAIAAATTRAARQEVRASIGLALEIIRRSGRANR